MKITYGREEGGFAVYHDGRKVAVFRVKGWMNGLREWPGITPGCVKSGKISGFEKTQFEYNGRWI